MVEAKCNGQDCPIKRNCRYFIMHELQEQYCCGEVDARRVDAKYQNGRCINYFALHSELNTNELIGKLPQKIEVDGNIWQLRLIDKEDAVTYYVMYHGEEVETYICYGRCMRYSVLKTLSWLWGMGYVDE